MKSLKELREVVEQNRIDGKDYLYDGLSSAEIGKLSRAEMFGDNGEAFPDENEWSCWVD